MTLFEMEKISKGKGYAPTISRGNCVEIQRIDEENKFVDDEAAVKAAIKDGIAIIPVEELPENFGDEVGSFRYLGWVDTTENRKAIEEYCRIIKKKK